MALRTDTPLQAAIVDLDGTMIDTLGDFAAALNAVTHWGRYAEIFAYHEDADQFSLDDPS